MKRQRWWVFEKEPLWAEIALLIFAGKGIQFGEFKLKMHEKHADAPLSPIYINLRGEPKGPFSPKTLAQLGYHLARRVLGTTAVGQHIVGIPEAGVPLAESCFTTLQYTQTNISLLKLNKNVSVEGRKIGTELTGEFKVGDSANLIDDLITAADTKLEAVESLRANGVRVRNCFVIVDREQGGREQLENTGVQLYALTTLTELLRFYAEIGLVAPEKVEEVFDYRRRVDEYLATQEKK